MIQYNAYGGFFGVPFTITGFFQYVIPLPEPKHGLCPLLIPRIEDQIWLEERERMTIELGSPPVVIRATQLITCACVIYLSNNTGKIHIHHAMGGGLYDEDVDIAFAGLNTPYINSVYVIFAHPEGNNPIYQESLDLLEERGISENQIIEITNGPPQFGVNYLGQIGG